MADVSDPEIREAVEDVRSDFTDTDWLILSYEGKTKIVVGGTGQGGHDELSENLDDAKVQFCLLRLVDGDRESKRVKFVFITFCGDGVGGLARGRVGAHSLSVKPLMGQCNVDLRADDLSEMKLKDIMKKLKVAGGADYDTGANAKGYKSNASGLHAKALAAYQEKEKEGNIGGVVYVTSALPSVTPVDLGGRPMVASASAAKRNTKDTILDTDKFKGKAGVAKKPTTGGQPRVRVSSTAKRPPPGKKPSQVAKPKPAASKPKPAASKPKPAASKPKPATAKPAAAAKKAEPVKAKAKAKPASKNTAATEGATGEHRRSSVLNAPVVEDAEERARIRAERRKAKREENARKAAEEVAALKDQLLSADPTPQASPEKAAPAAEEEEEESEYEEVEVEIEVEVEVDDDEEEEEAEEAEEEAAPEPEPEPVKAAPKKKKTSLFDDDDDDDDLFKSAPKKAAPKGGKKKSSLFDDDDEEEEEAAAPEPEVEEPEVEEPEVQEPEPVDDRTVTVSFVALKTFLEGNGCLPDDVSSPQDLVDAIES